MFRGELVANKSNRRLLVLQARQQIAENHETAKLPLSIESHTVMRIHIVSANTSIYPKTTDVGVDEYVLCIS